MCRKIRFDLEVEDGTRSHSARCSECQRKAVKSRSEPATQTTRGRQRIPCPFQNPSRAVVASCVPRPAPQSARRSSSILKRSDPRSHGTRRSQRPSTGPHAPDPTARARPRIQNLSFRSSGQRPAVCCLSKSASPPEINPPTTRSLGNYYTTRGTRGGGGGALSRGGYKRRRWTARGECVHHEMIPPNPLPLPPPPSNHAVIEWEQTKPTRVPRMVVV